MYTQTESLNRLLRCELTAVHQQFIHVLALRSWGQLELAERIIQIDSIDFPNAMRIINYLIATKASIELHADHFKPGRTPRGILAAELEVERRMAGVIERGSCTDDRPLKLFAAAKAPRQDYARWLNAQLESLAAEEDVHTDNTQNTSRLFGCLITVIEQSMVHAFIHYHDDRSDLADMAWSTSGAAMMQATEFVHQYSAQHMVPFPEDIPSSKVEFLKAGIFDADSQLAKRCAAEAAQAATACDNAEIKSFCRQLADYYAQLANFKAGSVYPAWDRNPAAFQSFCATLHRFDVLC